MYPGLLDTIEEVILDILCIKKCLLASRMVVDAIVRTVEPGR